MRSIGLNLALLLASTQFATVAGQRILHLFSDFISSPPYAQQTDMAANNEHADRPQHVRSSQATINCQERKAMMNGSSKSANGTYVTHLECSLTGKRYAHDRMRYLSDDGAPLLVRYDLELMRGQLDRDAVVQRQGGLWMWRDFLPVGNDVRYVTLGETITPLVPIRLNRNPGAGNVLVKDEGRLPTGSFKARGMAVAVTMARYFNKTELVVPTAGNAGAAAAAYGAAAGMKVHVVAPRDTPDITLREIAFLGAQTHQVDGLIDLCGEVARTSATEHGWHNLATLAEPYRLEGKKTIGLELAYQFGWSLPDIVYYPTGGGTGFIGMWKAFPRTARIGLDQRKVSAHGRCANAGLLPDQVRI